MSQELDQIRRPFREWARTMQRQAPFYTRIARHVLDRDDVLSVLFACPVPEQRTPVLLFAAVHDLLLEHPDLPLAQWYPSIAPDPRDDDPGRAFVETVVAHRTHLERTVATRSTQTNEVGRCALFLPVLARLADEVGPLALLDIGASAGLVLNFDRYSYDYDGRVVHPVDGPSAVRVSCRTDGTVPVPRAMPPIVDRLGLDQHPVDVANPLAARWLRACVWPDQLDRLDRLDGAIAIAQHQPVEVRRGDAVDDLASAVDDLDGHPVVMNSWVLNYLTARRRSDYVEALDQIGADRGLSWVFAESPHVTPDLPHPNADHPESTHLNLVRWRDGVRAVEFLAECHPHGVSATWRHDG